MKKDEILSVWECEVTNIFMSKFWAFCREEDESFIFDVADIQKDEKDLLEIGAKFIYVQLRVFNPSVRRVDYITFKNELLPHA